MKDKKKLYLGLFVIAGMIAIIFGSSCNTSRKTKSSSLHKSDSASTVSIKAAAVKKYDSHKFSSKDSSGTTDITLEFADENSDQDVPDTNVGDKDPVQEANDLAGQQKTSKGTGKYNYNVGGIPISSSQPLKSAGIKIQGKLSTYDLTNVSKKDSSTIDKKESSHVITVDQTKDKGSEKTYSSLWMWLSIAVVLTVGLYIWKGGRFDSIVGLFKKKKAVPGQYTDLNS